MKKSKQSRGAADLITIAEAARLLSLKETLIRRWLSTGLVKTHKNPKAELRVSRKEILDFASQLGLNPLSGTRDVPPDVLIVDDDAEVIRWLKLFMKKNYPLFKIDCAVNGFEAGIKLRDFAPMLVLLDMRMPGIDGIEVCKTIRKRPKLKNIHILGITVSRVKAELDDFRRAGADDIIFKPMLEDELRESINKIMLVPHK